MDTSVSNNDVGEGHGRIEVRIEELTSFAMNIRFELTIMIDSWLTIQSSYSIE